MDEPNDVPAQEVAADQMDPAMEEGMEAAMDGEMGEAMDMEGDGMEGEGDMDEGMAGSGQDMDMEAAPVEESKTDNYAADPRIKWMSNSLDQLEAFSQDGGYLTNDKLMKFHDFLSSQDYTKFFCWIELGSGELSWSFDRAPKFYDSDIKADDYQVIFYLKMSGKEEIDMDNIEQCIMPGMIDRDPLNNLLEKMNVEYCPKLLGENAWPEGVKKEFAQNLHKFMCNLTDACHKRVGRTQLYIPNEDLHDIEAAAKEKDQIQRLEAIVIYWTQQIKKLVSNQDSQTGGDQNSPLDEIKHWNQRHGNLSVLKTTLEEKRLLRIIEVLAKAQSSYHGGFMELKDKINEEFETAHDSLKFLTILEGPCRKIEASQPKDIPKLLPEVLNGVRMIFELSQSYNTSERMRGLLTRISNQIIQRCKAKIDKEDMLGRDVEKCIADLTESIDCCEQWKEISEHKMVMLKLHSNRNEHWDLEKDEQIFAEIDAFIQRCRDLMEICEGQLQFALRGASCQMPIFGGKKGKEYTISLEELKKRFDESLKGIKALNYDILDVKQTYWHDDFGQVYKDAVKEIEIFYTTIIQLTFKHVSTVSDAVEMLENFQQLAKRVSIQEYVYQKAANQVYNLFLAEMKEVEIQFDIGGSKKRPPMPVSHPFFGGLSIWAYSLICRIDKANNMIQELYFVPPSALSEEVHEKYKKLKLQLDTYIGTINFKDWVSTLGDMSETDAVQLKLAVPILRKMEEEVAVAKPGKDGAPSKQAAAVRTDSGRLRSNFNVPLLKVMHEVNYWNKIQTIGLVNMPHAIVRLLTENEQLRKLREQVMTVVRLYNNIQDLINDNERDLFQEHLEKLDGHIQPGIVKYDWKSGGCEPFVEFCCKECHSVYGKIKIFQQRKGEIDGEIDNISNTTLTDIHKRLYDLNSFINAQETNLRKHTQEYKDKLDYILERINITYQEQFIDRRNSIQKTWARFVNDIDKRFKEALKNSVKNSFLDLQKHIKTEGSDVVAIFRVFTKLDKTTGTQWSIIHEPNHSIIRQNIVQLMDKIRGFTLALKRMEVTFREKRELMVQESVKEIMMQKEKSGGGSFGGRTKEEDMEALTAKWNIPALEKIEQYPEMIWKSKSVRTIYDQVKREIDKIKQVLDDDEKRQMVEPEFRQLMNMQTERGKKRFLRSAEATDPDDPVANYRTTIEQMQTNMQEMANKASTQARFFIQLDYTSLRNDQKDCARKLVTEIQEHLIKESKQELNNHLELLNDTVEELKKNCTSLDMLKAHKERHSNVRSQQETWQNRLAPIKKKFEYIKGWEGEGDSGEVEGLTEDDVRKVETLDESWRNFLIGMQEANGIISRNFQEQKQEMESQITDLKGDVTENLKTFNKECPRTIESKSNADLEETRKAQEKIAEFRMACQDLRKREEDMDKGLQIFDISPENYAELVQVEKKNENLSDLWAIKQEWEDQWMQWKDIQFYNLEMSEIQDTADMFHMKLKKLINKQDPWPVYDILHKRMREFTQTMQILPDLRHESIRERHWQIIRLEVKEEFNERSDEFTLEEVFKLGFLDFQDVIDQTTDEAKKQMKVEKDLMDIEHVWKNDPISDLYIVKSKSKADEEFYKVGSTDNIMTLIEDHTAILATHKASAFYKNFDVEIDLWEDNIAKMNETLDLLIQATTKWQYLESIFCGQPDIIRMLGEEDAKFQKSNKIFKAQMVRVNKDKNCYKALITGVSNFTKTLSDMVANFETIQKSLVQFLESKRGKFPRFYFLPNDDLLEIIGMGKNPEPLNKHIQKIFNGVVSLEAEPAPKGSSAKYYIKSLLAENNEESIELDAGATDGKKLEVDQNVEEWLGNKESGLIVRMREALQRLFRVVANDTNQNRRIREHSYMKQWITGQKGQILVTAAQIEWTKLCHDALGQIDKITVNPSSNNHPIKTLKTTYRKKCNIYIDVVEKTPGLTALDRKKLTALIIIEQHHSEVIDRFFLNKQIKRTHFDWLSQLRFTLNEPDAAENLFMVTCEQMSAVFDYGYEYQGNVPRLVITALTDRAYMTLTTALAMFRGGAPQGPAGTGKTETVKDLAKNLSFWCVVQNCDGAMDPPTLSKILAGVSAAGAWGCFDEFNRISLDVLSVITSMFEAIFDCQRRGDGNATTLGDIPTQVSKDAGFFITMNPGYAGRSALPDNLAALFRPVAMMKADFQAIARIELMSVGFKEAEPLATKIVSMYDLMEKQLSKEPHYMFQMRELKAVLRAAGQIKTKSPQLNETSVCIKAIRDMNLAKLISDDVILFDKMFEDLFPDCEEPEVNMDDLQIALEDCLDETGRQLNENIVVKAMQLYEQNQVRHGILILGNTMSGKSTIWQILERSMNNLSKVNAEKYKPVQILKMNPKAIHADEFYGAMDDSPEPQYIMGVFPHLLKGMITDVNTHNRWLLMDGPVDTLWIESMNSLLDDSKLLTLNNGDRLPLASNCKLLFETENLDVASPATISRVGLLYMDIAELGYQPMLAKWIDSKDKENVGIKGEDYKAHLQELVIKYIPKVMNTKKTVCKELVKSSETGSIINFCKLYDSIWGNTVKAPDGDTTNFMSYIEKIFVFAIIWSIGATLAEQSRRELDLVLRDIEPMFPHLNTVYEYHVSPEKQDFSPWEDFIQNNWKPQADLPFWEIYVPTVDTARYSELIKHLLRIDQHIMFVGVSGVGKTKRIQSLLDIQDESIETFTINFSAGTGAAAVQDVIESHYEKKAKNKYKPRKAKKKAIAFIDDFNMPRKEVYGAQPPIEIIRQVMDHGFWYHRKELKPNIIQNLELITAMGEPGGGRTDITPRIISNFHMLNYTQPNEGVMKTIYGTILDYKFNGFYDDIKQLTEPLVLATIQIFNVVKASFMPTPQLCHYQFNMRDISKVFLGLFKANKGFYDTGEQMIKLWGHEIQRVFQDRLNETEGYYDHQTRFRGILDEALVQHLDKNFKEHVATMKDEETFVDPIFVDFLAYEDLRVYMEVPEMDKLKESMEESLVACNNAPRAVRLDMVLFEQAITMVTKVHRVFSTERGHLVLAGLPSVGRKSVCRLASFVEEMNMTRLELSKNFGLTQFRQKMKQVWELCAYNGREKLKTVFLLDETDIVQESFLEDVQNILSSGLVPNLYSSDDLGRIRDEMKSAYKLAGNTEEIPDLMNAFFYDRVINNLHLAYIVSSDLKVFSEQCKAFPALINNASFIYYFPWPAEGLYEVAKVFMSKIEDLPTGMDVAISETARDFYCDTMTKKAILIKKSLNRDCPLLPSLYTQFLAGYKFVLEAQREDIGKSIEKYRAGITKLEFASQQVDEMGKESEVQNVEISAAKAKAEIKEGEINVAKKSIGSALEELTARKKFIEGEKVEAQNLAAAADVELEKAMPALLAANKAVDSLDAKYIAEMKSMNTPHVDTHNVMQAVMIFMGETGEWMNIKKVISKPSFKKDLQGFDKDNISEKKMKGVQRFTKQENFNETKMLTISAAAAALCVWVKAIEEYAQALKVVKPKLEKKNAALAKVAAMVAELEAMEAKYNDMMAELAELEAAFALLMEQMQIYKDTLAKLSLQIDRGEMLVSGLGGEKVRWSATQLHLEDMYEKLVGDCFMAAAFNSFMGPYPNDYRIDINKDMMQYVKKYHIPHDVHFTFAGFMSTESQVREWQLKELPGDNFSTENAVLIQKSENWCTNIDPQNQCNIFLKRKCGKSLQVIDFKDKKYVTLIERACQNGKTVLLEDIQEALDPTLNNIVSKNYITLGKKRKVMVGDRELDWHPKFQLYITTRIPNPTFDTVIVGSTTVVNFSVTEPALEEQCLGIVVQQEAPQIEQTKNDNIKKIADNTSMLQQLEDEILSSLQNQKGSLLEDVDLINTLNTAKEKSEEAKSAQETLKISMKKINDSRENFRPAGKIAAALYFVLFEMNIVDPMYQFSLKWYKALFLRSISESKEINSPDRMKCITTAHNLNVYRQACRTLFEKHKLLLSLQMCTKLMSQEGLVDHDEYQFFLRGGVVIDRTGQAVRPPNSDWITDAAWDNCCELEKKIDLYQGLTSAIQLNAKEWFRWFSSTKPDPEKTQLPGEWQSKCDDDMKQMIILRCFRPDRVRFAIINFVNTYFKGNDFTSSRSATMSEIYEESSPECPIIFVMAPGVDPTEQLKRFADEVQIKVVSISLGKGQGERAKSMLKKSSIDGNWCFLSNCHLSVNLLPELENILDELIAEGNFQSSFRIFMSASSTPGFPISMLQRSIKMATEPPRGIKPNFIRMYSNMNKSFTKCEKDMEFRKACYGLVWFHAMMIERKKFKTLGFNTPYAFNDSDYQVCEDLLSLYFGKYKDGGRNPDFEANVPINWQAIRTLIAEANYGGRVTDQRDRDLVNVYCKDVFNDDLVSIERWKPVGTAEYKFLYPFDETNIKPDQQAFMNPDYYATEINTGPNAMQDGEDPPVAFGQHANAGIAAQIGETQELLENIVRLQPLQTTEGQSAEQILLGKIKGIQEVLPEQIDFMELKFKLRSDDNPLNVVLLQEVERYNVMLNMIAKDLYSLDRGVQGLSVITNSLQDIADSMLLERVPDKWGAFYFSLKGLPRWLEDIQSRMEFFSKWCAKGLPYVFLISAFMYPNGFNTALLQRFSRRSFGANIVSIDRLVFDFLIIPRPVNDITEYAKDGAYVTGLILEGAKWHKEKQYLTEPDIMELYDDMPVIHFKPISKRTKPLPNSYGCPVYYYPNRAGNVSRESYVMQIDLKSGEVPPTFWIKRGTALLLSNAL